MKKMLSILLCAVLMFSLTACGVTNFNKGKDDREKVVDLILSGEVDIAENGAITLPEDLSKLSDSGECFLVNFKGESALYFFTFRGLLGESKGYVYVTDRIEWQDYVNEDVYEDMMYWTETEELEANWYSVKTE